MSKKTIWRMVGMGAVVIALLFGVSAIINRNEVTKEPVQIATQTQTITVTIEGLYSDKNVQISSSETALEILQRLDTQDEEVQLLTREYSGLGVLVESIGGNSNGMNDEYWQYKVNGVMPQIGADKLEIKNGDAIEWYFARSEF
jgi:hypothetical protein